MSRPIKPPAEALAEALAIACVLLRPYYDEAPERVGKYLDLDARALVRLWAEMGDLAKATMAADIRDRLDSLAVDRGLLPPIWERGGKPL